MPLGQISNIGRPLEAKPLGQIDVTDAGVAGVVRKDFLPA